MVKKHPCLECDDHLKGVNKNTNLKCISCKDVELYDQQIRESQPTTVQEIKSENCIDSIAPKVDNTEPIKSASPVQPKTKKACSVDDCEKPVLAKGKCSYHYWSAHRNTNPKKKKSIDTAQLSADDILKSEKIPFVLPNEIFDKIIKISKSEMRTPENQIIFFIKKAVENYYVDEMKQQQYLLIRP